MGHKDLVALHKIYEKAKEYCKIHKLPYHFKVDSGSFETAIEFSDMGHHHHPPKSENWEASREAGNEIKCPDILDYYNKIIIEFEEEGCKKRSGAAIASKGHGFEGDMPTLKDTERNRLYNLCKFRFLRFYEADLKKNNWNKLYSFLSECGNFVKATGGTP